MLPTVEAQDSFGAVEVLFGSCGFGF